MTPERRKKVQAMAEQSASPAEAEVAQALLGLNVTLEAVSEGAPIVPHSWYILVGHTPVPAADVLEWGRWYETADRRVAQDILPNDSHSVDCTCAVCEDGVRVSTVFLGLDHNFFPGGIPILFETMIFGGEHSDYQERYATWEQAEAGHRRVVQALKQGEAP